VKRVARVAGIDVEPAAPRVTPAAVQGGVHHGTVPLRHRPAAVAAATVLHGLPRALAEAQRQGQGGEWRQGRAAEEVDEVEAAEEVDLPESDDETLDGSSFNRRVPRRILLPDLEDDAPPSFEALKLALYVHYELKHTEFGHDPVQYMLRAPSLREKVSRHGCRALFASIAAAACVRPLARKCVDGADRRCAGAVACLTLLPCAV
jgi:hypothetical protein